MIGYETYLNEGLTENQKDFKQRLLSIYASNPYNIKPDEGVGYIPVHKDLDGFIDLIKKAIDIDQAGKPNQIFFLDNFSKINVFEDPLVAGKDALGIVGYHLRRRTPGTTAPTNTPMNGSRKDVRPQLRAITYDAAGKPQQATFHYSQWFDNRICLEMYAKSNKEANDMAMWFEELMEKNRPFFASYGIMKYHFEERESDAINKDGDSVVHIRPLIYWVRTERNYEVDEQTINNIVTKITTT